MNLPSYFAVGESVEWGLNSDVYPFSAWTVTYYFRGASVLNVVGTASGIYTHAFQITSTQSAALLPGIYYFQAFAQSGTQRKLIQEGKIEVRPSLISALAGYDGRTENEKTLGAIRAALAGAGGDKVQSYLISTPHGSREIRSYSLTELMDLDKYFSALVAKERAQKRAKAGLPSVKSIPLTFGRTS